MVLAGLGADEWALLRSAPWVVAVGAMMSGPGGSLGRRDELAAVSRAEQRFLAQLDEAFGVAPAPQGR